MKIFRHLVLLAALALPVTVHAQSLPTQGAKSYSTIWPNNNTCIRVKATAGVITDMQLGSISATTAFLKIYDSAAVPTAGSGTPVMRLPFPSTTTGQLAQIPLPAARKFSNGIGICVVTGITDANTTAPAADNFIVNIGYN